MSFVQNVAPTLVKQPMNGKVQIANADASNQKTVYTAGASGSKVTSLIAASTDTSARDVQVSITNGGTSFLISTVSVPAGAGSASGNPCINMFNPNSVPGLPVDSDGNAYIHLMSGDTLTVSSVTTVTATKLITVSAPTIGDF